MKLLIDDAKAKALADDPGLYPRYETVRHLLIDRNALLSRIAALYKERKHWKANHDNQVKLSKLLRDRPDLPVERTHAYRQFEALQKREAELEYANSLLVDVRAKLNARIVELEAERDRQREEIERLRNKMTAMTGETDR